MLHVARINLKFSLVIIITYGIIAMLLLLTCVDVSGVDATDRVILTSL